MNISKISGFESEEEFVKLLLLKVVGDIVLEFKVDVGAGDGRDEFINKLDMYHRSFSKGVPLKIL